MTKRYIERPAVAKMIRKHLRRDFPGVKFSVRSETYSGGGCIDIRWTDGPTQEQVQAVTGEYSSRGFDGMIDMAYDYDHWLLPDGTVITAGTRGTEGSRGTVAAFEVEKPHPDAERVRLDAGYVSCHRELSDGFKTNLRQAWREMTDQERHDLAWKLEPWRGCYRLESWRTDAEMADLTKDQRDHWFWQLARQIPVGVRA